jgi:hypothetical protein
MTTTRNARAVVAALITATALGACTSVPMASSDADMQAKQFQPPPVEQSTLYVFREGIFGAAILLNASLGQRTLGQLGPDNYFRVDLKPGEYDMRCSGIEGAGSTAVRIAPGETRFVEVAARLGIGSARCAIFEVSEQQGRSAIAHSKRAAEIR